MFIVSLYLSASCLSANDTKREPVDYVNPYMGNISHLLVPTYPTVHLPNSLLRVYPSRKDFTGDLLNGLPLIVTSHRGKPAFNLSPFQGSEQEIKPVINYSYDQEKITPYSYEVYLDEHDTEVQYAISHQAALYKFRFEKNTPPYLIINSKDGGLKWDGKAASGFQAIGNGTKVYIYFEPEISPEDVFVLSNGEIRKEKAVDGKNACMIMKFNGKALVLHARYGISFIDEDQARENMLREVKNYELDPGEHELIFSAICYLDEIAMVNITGNTSKVITLTENSEAGRVYGEFQNILALEQKIEENNDIANWNEEQIYDGVTGATILEDNSSTEFQHAELFIGNSLTDYGDVYGQYWIKIQYGTYPITGKSEGYASKTQIVKILPDSRIYKNYYLSPE